MKRRILLADDSPHAQRMGERILREEGYEVVSVTDGETALLRARDFDPDVIIADISLPGVSGYDLCKEIKSTKGSGFTKVILTAGLLEHFDADRAAQAGYDGSLRKPFEASAMLELVHSLVEAGIVARQMFSEEEAARVVRVDNADTAPPRLFIPLPVRSEPHIELPPEPEPPAVSEPEPAPPAPAIAGIDPGLVRAAVTLAVESAIPSLIDEITARVLETLDKDKTS